VWIDSNRFSHHYYTDRVPLHEGVWAHMKWLTPLKKSNGGVWWQGMATMARHSTFWTTYILFTQTSLFSISECFYSCSKTMLYAGILNNLYSKPLSLRNKLWRCFSRPWTPLGSSPLRSPSLAPPTMRAMEGATSKFLGGPNCSLKLRFPAFPPLYLSFNSSYPPFHFASCPLEVGPLNTASGSVGMQCKLPQWKFDAF